MKKILLSLLLCIGILNAYVTADYSYSSTGGTPGTTQSSMATLLGITGSDTCTSNCSTVWHYNATSTENVNQLDVNKYFNPKIVDTTTFKVSNNDVAITKFIERGLTFFKNQNLSVVQDPNNRKAEYNVFTMVREIKDNVDFDETITKSGNDFTVGSTNKENYTIHLNSETIYNSFLFGQVETNTGLVAGYTYRNRMLKIGLKKYHFIELEKINFLDALVSKYNEYCSKENNYHFPYIYEPSNFFYSFVNNTNNVSTPLDPNLNQYAYPNSMFTSGTNGAKISNVKTGMISMPCKSEHIGSDPYETIKSLSAIVDNNKITYFNAYRGFGIDAILVDAKKYFYDNGYALKLSQLDPRNMLQIGTSFFSAMMQERKIEGGIITKSNQVTIKNNYWKSGKCPTHYNKKTMSIDSEIYYMSSLNYDLPFNELHASFDITNSLKISSYSPIAAFPNSEESIYALTPDNHILAHSINNTDNTMNQMFMNNLNNGGKPGFQDNHEITRQWKQKCSSFNLFAFILLIIVVVVTIYSGGLAAGAWGPLTGSGMLYSSTGLLLGIGTATTAAASIMASTAFLLGLAASYVLYTNLYSGEDTSPGGVNQSNYTHHLEALESIEALRSGSSMYMNFLNIKKTLNSLGDKTFFITPKQYSQITDVSIMLTDSKVIPEMSSAGEILGLNTPNEINHLYSLTFAHAEPGTLPPNFRYYGYTKVNLVPTNVETYNWESVASTGGSNDILNLSKMENSFLVDMHGYRVSSDTTSSCSSSGRTGGKFDMFNTQCVMMKILNTFSPVDISKYNNP